MATTVGQLTIEMAANIVRLQQDMDKAKNTVSSAMNSIQKAADTAANALGMIGLGLSGIAMGAFVKSAIDAADRLDDLSKKTGLSAESLSSLSFAFKMSNVEIDTMQKALTKLSKNAIDNEDAFTALGISVKNTDGTYKQADVIFKEVAKFFAIMPDGVLKTKLSLELFDKAGADLIPILNSGANGIEEMTKRAEDLGLVISTEATKASEEFKDQLDTLHQQMIATTVNGMTPFIKSASDLIESLMKLPKLLEENATSLMLWSAIIVAPAIVAGIPALVAGLSAMAAGVVAVGVAFAANPIALILMTLTAAAIPAINAINDYANANKAAEKANAGLNQTTAETARLLRLNKEVADGNNKASDEAALKMAEAAIKAKERAAEEKKLNDELLKQAEAYRKLISGIEEKTALNNAEALSVDKLTESQKLEIKYKAELESGTLKLTKAQQENLFVKLKALKASEDAVAIEKLEKEILDESAKSNLAVYEALVKKNKTIEDEVTKQKESNAEMLLGADAVAQLAIEKLRDQAISADRNAEIFKEANPEIANAYLEQAKALRELADAREGGIGAKAAKESADAWKKTSESIQSTLTDALMRGFESGKDFGKNLMDTLVNMFKTLILRPIIQPIAQGASSLILSMMGMGTAGSAMASGGGGGAGASTAMTGMALSMSQFGSFMANGFMNSMFNSFAGQAQATQMLAANGSYAQAAGMGAGTVAGYAAGAAVGVYGGRAIGNGYSLSGGTGNGTINAGTAIGMVVGGPIGAAIGGAIAGAVNRAFGRKQTDMGIEGTLSTSEGIEGQTYKFLKGGWFRSNKTIREALSNDIEVMFDSSIELITKQTKFYANALGLPAQAIDTFTQSIKLSFQGLSEEEINQKIADALVSFQEGLVAQYSTLLEPLKIAGETLVQTLERLAMIQEISSYLNEFGGAFSTFATASVQARQGIIELAGGLDELVKKTQGFVANFYSQEEQAGITARGVVQALADAGFSAAQIAALDTRADFRTLLESIDVNNTEGQRQFVALLDVAQTFAQLTPIMEEQSKSLVELMEAAPQIEILQKMFESDADYQTRKQTADELAQDTFTSMEKLLGDLNVSIADLSYVIGTTLDNIGTSTESAIALANNALATANSAISSANASAASVISAIGAITSSTNSKGVVVEQAFASGGSYGGGMALVGEQGPELIDFNNSGTVYNASQSANIIGGEVAGEIRALRDEVSMLRYEARATAVSTSKMAKLQDNWDTRGLVVKSLTTAEPVYTKAV